MAYVEALPAATNTIRRWMKGSLIGAGSFGRVSLAINRDNGELFAVKSMRCTDRTKREVEAMNNEINLLTCLDSPFIIRCLGSDYSTDEEGGGSQVRNMFMEYMPGGSLTDLMNKFGGKLDESLARIYTRGILLGLQYIHKQGVVHCDIKGKNILVGAGGGVKLADFGAAKQVASKDGCESSSKHSMKGTPLWMAPEVVQQLEQTPASDIWSLGCTLVEMITGKAPWSDSPNPLAAMFRIGCTQEIPSLPLDCLSVDGRDFVLHCLQRDPKARWTSEQLLDHPFVSQKKSHSSHSSHSDGFLAPLSPTSILDFHCDASWDSRMTDSLHSLQRTLPLQSIKEGQESSSSSSSAAAAKEKEYDPSSSSSSSSSSSPSSGQQWIVVKSHKGFSSDNSSPPLKPFSDFMLHSPPLSSSSSSSSSPLWQGTKGLILKKSSEVDLDCLASLRNRRQKFNLHLQLQTEVVAQDEREEELALLQP